MFVFNLPIILETQPIALEKSLAGKISVVARGVVRQVFCRAIALSNFGTKVLQIL
ncbi:MAG: hypothetical protein KME22_29730 [Hassallia sp. WJT32-NPBG1]|nr:hypothetical protein [Hassallia sp. WJT32-NPBG1]